MLILSAFINNIVNQLIRNLSWSLRITISTIFICLAIVSVYKLVKTLPKYDDLLKKSYMKYGWLVLALLSMVISVLYIVL